MEKEKIKVDDFVQVSGEGDNLFKITKILENTVVLHTGWKEPFHKIIKIVPSNKVYTHTSYYEKD